VSLQPATKSGDGIDSSHAVTRGESSRPKARKHRMLFPRT